MFPVLIEEKLKEILIELESVFFEFLQIPQLLALETLKVPLDLSAVGISEKVKQEKEAESNAAEVQHEIDGGEDQSVRDTVGNTEYDPWSRKTARFSVAKSGYDPDDEVYSGQEVQGSIAHHTTAIGCGEMETDRPSPISLCGSFLIVHTIAVSLSFECIEDIAV